MPRGLQHKGIVRRNKIVRAAAGMFLANGYEKTTTAAIAREAGVTTSSFFAAFENKEALLLILVKQMFNNQFSSAAQSSAGEMDPLLLYSIETVMQLYIAEGSESLRDLYVTAYSLPSTSEYIYKQMIDKLMYIFGKYLPDAQMKDFYEMDIASAGIMRAFMARRCDVYFTMAQKVRRYLQCSFTLYGVPVEKQKEIISAIEQMDFVALSQKTVHDMLAKIEAGLDDPNA